MRSRPDPVSGTTSVRPSAASTEDSPRSAPLPVVHNGVFHEDVRRSIESALQITPDPCSSRQAWSDSGAAEIVPALASLPVDAMQHSIGDVEGRAGDA